MVIQMAFSHFIWDENLLTNPRNQRKFNSQEPYHSSAIVSCVQCGYTISRPRSDLHLNRRSDGKGVLISICRVRGPESRAYLSNNELSEVLHYFLCLKNRSILLINGQGGVIKGGLVCTTVLLYLNVGMSQVGKCSFTAYTIF